MSASRPTVVDASALAAVLFGEPRADEAARRLGEGPWLAPTLLRYEIASVCRKKRARSPEAAAALLEALELFDRLELDEVEVPASAALELAEAHDLTVYDAAYLWLAGTLGGRLVTLDTQLGEVAERLGR